MESPAGVQSSHVLGQLGYRREESLRVASKPPEPGILLVDCLRPLGLALVPLFAFPLLVSALCPWDGTYPFLLLEVQGCFLPCESAVDSY